MTWLFIVLPLMVLAIAIAIAIAVVPVLVNSFREHRSLQGTGPVRTGIGERRSRYRTRRRVPTEMDRPGDSTSTTP